MVDHVPPHSPVRQWVLSFPYPLRFMLTYHPQVMGLNLHFHVLFIDGVCSPKSNGDLRFHRINVPTSKELNALVATISESVAR